VASRDPLDRDLDPEADSSRPTGEVGSEGGTAGDVEIEENQQGTGTEAGETWRPANRRTAQIVRNETALRRPAQGGRRNP
jgi:hypothetical protein